MKIRNQTIRYGACAWLSLLAACSSASDVDGTNTAASMNLKSVTLGDNPLECGSRSREEIIAELQVNTKTTIASEITSFPSAITVPYYFVSNKTNMSPAFFQSFNSIDDKGIYHEVSGPFPHYVAPAGQHITEIWYESAQDYNDESKFFNNFELEFAGEGRTYNCLLPDATVIAPTDAIQLPGGDSDLPERRLRYSVDLSNDTECTAMLNYQQTLTVSVDTTKVQSSNGGFEYERIDLYDSEGNVLGVADYSMNFGALRTFTTNKQVARAQIYLRVLPATGESEIKPGIAATSVIVQERCEKVAD